MPAVRGRLWIVDLADHQPRRSHTVRLIATVWDLASLQLLEHLSTLTPSVTLLDRLPLSFETAPLEVASILPGAENMFSRRGCWGLETNIYRWRDGGRLCFFWRLLGLNRTLL